MIVLMKILQVLLALSILVAIHELGHFLFAKMFRIRVDKFYLFFDIGGFALFRFKPKGSDTEYGIGWLPLGGYCKIAGMIDESMDTESLKQPPQPWEFRSKPAWQRLLVMSGGVLFNFIFAIMLYIGILAGWGESYISNDGNSIYVNDLAYEMGFRNGDRILKFDDYVPEDFFRLQLDLATRTPQKVTILRDNDTIDIYIDHNRIKDILNSPNIMFDLAVPFIIDSIPPTSINYGKDLLAGDQIVAINGHKLNYYQDSQKILPNYAGQTIPMSVVRESDTTNINVQVDSLGRLGVYITKIFPDTSIKSKNYSIIEAIPAGIKLTFSSIGDYLRQIKLVVNPSTEAYKSVGSFIAIGQIFPGTWHWKSFLNILALLSIMLGVMNLLPIPALDGGHIVFTVYEMITGHKPSDRFLTVAQIIGMILLFGLMILAFGNDIGRLFR